MVGACSVRDTAMPHPPPQPITMMQGRGTAGAGAGAGVGGRGSGGSPLDRMMDPTRSSPTNPLPFLVASHGVARGDGQRSSERRIRNRRRKSSGIRSSQKIGSMTVEGPQCHRSPVPLGAGARARGAAATQLLGRLQMFASIARLRHLPANFQH